MSNEEIIKALEYCCEDTSICPEECPYYKCKGGYITCFEKMQKDALDLINRRQAEIERLTKYNTDVAYKHYNDGIKEFAEKVENKLGIPFMVNNQVVGIVLDETIKEMVGAEDE